MSACVTCRHSSSSRASACASVRRSVRAPRAHCDVAVSRSQCVSCCSARPPLRCSLRPLASIAGYCVGQSIVVSAAAVPVRIVGRRCVCRVHHDGGSRRRACRGRSCPRRGSRRRARRSIFSGRTAAASASRPSACTAAAAATASASARRAHGCERTLGVRVCQHGEARPVPCPVRGWRHCAHNGVGRGGYHSRVVGVKKPGPAAPAPCDGRWLGPWLPLPVHGGRPELSLSMPPGHRTLRRYRRHARV